MKLVFLGTSGCIPDIGDDTASMLIDDKYLVDVGWDVVRNLRNKGVDPISVNTVFFTHMHHDHHMSLPAFLFYHLQRKHTLEHLTLVGPKEDLELVCGLSLDYLQISGVQTAGSSDHSSGGDHDAGRGYGHGLSLPSCGSRLVLPL